LDAFIQQEALGLVMLILLHETRKSDSSTQIVTVKAVRKMVVRKMLNEMEARQNQDTKA
jgi:hypothetical protein